MNQIKIGKFIKERRKIKKLTQNDLAIKLNITDRAVSKWERGISMPDSSLMLDLCAILEINVNELLSGEIIEIENFQEKTSQNILDLAAENERFTYFFIKARWILGGFFVLITVLLISIELIYINTHNINLNLFHLLNLFMILFIVLFTSVIDSFTECYECEHCHNQYHISFSQALFSPKNFSFTKRYLKCPHCLNKNWHKNVIHIK